MQRWAAMARATASANSRRLSCHNTCKTRGYTHATRGINTLGCIRGAFGHMKAFTCWVAGGGFKGGALIGQTDEFGYDVTADPVHVHDVHATILHLMGIDHTRLTYRFQGRDY